MDCKHFGECGACRIYENGYEYQLNQKLELNIERFKPFYSGKISVYESPEQNYRSRSEFKIWHAKCLDTGNGDIMRYAMNHIDKKGVVFIDECPQVSESISLLMPKLLQSITEKKMGFKLFGADFLSSSSGEIVVSLLYHRKLDEEWQAKAADIAGELGIYIIGRSRKQKVVIGQDYITESLKINDEIYKFKYIENSFTQPNSKVNEQMISWALNNSNDGGDLLELYCGAGNFTIPFAKKFDKVLATEISKSSINAAKANMILNDVHNIEFVRMSVEEFVQALDGVREFRRMNDININSYDIKSIFVDPPRSGMDEASCKFSSRYDNILYISCNPETLARDLAILSKTHVVENMALFDQFPYTHHVEMGVKLVKKGSDK
ncbi:tRNA (uridine(54)-C5)-methyltransferase TrmA [Sulfurimonas sp.]|uniref:tRNA (uridine(54)-C5)-methyltransferase TrmA n=1 Tax=Sulfurimonas sp. TaxID=2022749 RepID=UPI0026165163|nr:tRNA (uridine(54)-C5)-methyltransferase TrmA [Sulfurimonas sp.]MCW8895066.1 tRNA (uridine(54)-C5)-methyltransferase TrmA [Sulfurimonas sp.]